MTTVENFNAIYTANIDAVYRFCLRSVSRPAIAEDLASEVFLLLHERQHELLPTQLPTWLFTMARRRAADFWRHHYVEQRWPNAQPPGPLNLPAPEFALANVLDHCEGLEPIHDTCLILRFRHAMSLAEIAHQTQLTEPQVKRHLKDAFAIIRHHIDGSSASQQPRTAPPSSERRNF